MEHIRNLIKSLISNLLFIASLLIVIFMVCFGAWFLFIKKYGWEDRDSMDLSLIVNGAIGLPGYERYHIKQIDSDIYSFDRKNLFKYECGEKKIYDFEIYGERFIPPLSNLEANQQACLQFQGGNSPNSPIINELCNNPLSCKVMSLFSDDYIIKHDLLTKIIKILEKPCDYLPKADEIIKQFNWNERDIQNLRSSMKCKESWLEIPKQKYVLLYIKNRNTQEWIKILVDRKDI